MNDKLKKLHRKVHTKVLDGGKAVQYHNTIVAAVDGDKLTLDIGGWRSVTTKSRMNEFMAARGIPFRVYQKDFTWYIEEIGGKTLGSFDRKAVIEL